MKSAHIIFVAIGMTFGLLPFDGRTCAAEIDFDNDIAPIFENRCNYCHGEEEQESGLRLDSRRGMLIGGDSGQAAIVPGKPDKSYLLEAIRHADGAIAMPPDEDKLPAEEIALITRWIEQGAKWPGQMEAVTTQKSDHWSFQPIQRRPVPATSQDGQNPIDAFLLEKLTEKGLTFSTAADPRTLIRRASLVLTGLPPTREQAEAFLQEYQGDPEVAYTQLVDRLLASPHFGERWAQHWLDVIRWAESNGSESNMYRQNAWIYRDYVIRAFNEDKPYDEFLFEQIAGDTVKQGDATGYLVSGPHVPSATVGREPSARRQARADRMDEVLQTVGASAMGMTIGCARCHNHKFDPISINDYYEMAAVFQDVEFGGRYPEMKEDHPRAIRRREIITQLEDVRAQLRRIGSWEEDWTGYKEMYFPPQSTQAVRIKFASNFVRLDEIEIFGTEDPRENLARDTSGVEVDYSAEITRPASPVTRVNDGEFGNDSWIAQAQKGVAGKPWIQFTFTKPQQVERVRMSSNREDFWETDYLVGLNQSSFEPYTVEIQKADGTWQQVFSSSYFNKTQKVKAERASLITELEHLIQQMNNEGPRPSFVGRFIKPAKTFVFGRGSPENPRDEVFPAGLDELDGELDVSPYAPGPQRRVAFAKWLTDSHNPLTARVAANRIWHHVFGQGIVSTPSDFGAAGALPSHPELLDWLAAELMNPTQGEPATAKPWSMKHLIRMMVTSQAFMQSSHPHSVGLQADADSRLLWRFPPRRLEAEVIRDSVLLASGNLSHEIGGRSFRIHNVKARYAQWEVVDNHGPDTWRRMIYQERMRRVDDQLFTAFDFPDCGQVQPKRPVSTTPLQALNLLNSSFVNEQSERIAERARQEAGDSAPAQIDRCFELILGRDPSETEREACLEVVKTENLALVCRALINTNEFAFLP